MPIPAIHAGLCFMYVNYIYQEKIKKNSFMTKEREEQEMNLQGRSFLKLLDFTPEEILYLIELSAELKEKKKKGIAHGELAGKNIALIFEKTSTRERVLAPTRKGASRPSTEIQFRSSTRASRVSRALSGPTVTVLAAMSFPQTYTGSPIERPSPFRWPRV